MPRRPKNSRPDLNGLLIIDKPLGLSSAAVCRRVRALSGGAKVGHAGTLDPLATGVLVLCLGSSTTSAERVMAGEKRYLADVDLSAFSTTDDMEGEATPVAVERPPSEAQLREALAALTGTIMQAPPAFSAVHIGGERAYRLARRGAEVAPPARPVTIHSIDLLAYEFPLATLDVRCAKGTYIRSLARDLGVALNTGGRLAALRRTGVGEFTIDRALPLAELPQPIEPEHLLPPPPEPPLPSGSMP